MESEALEFLEAALRELMTNPDQPRKIVLAYINDEGVSISYKSCNYQDLQLIGQECINEGTMRLIALNEDRLQQLRDEADEQE